MRTGRFTSSETATPTEVDGPENAFVSPLSDIARRITKPSLVNAHTGAAALYILMGLVFLWPMFGPGSPPGIDAPTFLHMSWVTDRALGGNTDSFFTDPYWYSGFPFIQTYPPLTYGLIGSLSAVSPVSVETWYRVVAFISFAGLGMSVYWLSGVFGLKRPFALWAGALTLLSYTVYATLGVFGSLPTLAALPFAIVSFGMLERGMRETGRRSAVTGGLLLGVASLAHHMTAGAFIMGLVPYVAFVYVSRADRRPVVGRQLMRFGLAFAAISIAWGGFFVWELVKVGFRREIPGIWAFDLSTYRSQILNRDLIGVIAYPYYLGLVQVPLAVAGAILAFVNRSRIAGLALTALLFAWFSLGAEGNFLVRLFPFSGLDVSRFALFLAPFMALLAAYALSEALDVKRYNLNVPKAAVNASVAAALSLFLVLPVFDSLKAAGVLEPVNPPEGVELFIKWLSTDGGGADSKVYVVGMTNWDTYWVPQQAGAKLVDGWYDEGARSWRTVRELRTMGWTRNIDIERFHTILLEHGANYVSVVDWDSNESPVLFEQILDARPDLFPPVTGFPGARVYQVSAGR
jgi:hypothetical protein